MENRPIRGTTGWTRYEVVLDVAPDASRIAIGTCMLGRGSVYIDDVTLDEVDRSVPTTDLVVPESDHPLELDFER
jgi:hypothetical protein